MPVISERNRLLLKAHRSAVWLEQTDKEGTKGTECAGVLTHQHEQRRITPLKEPRVPPTTEAPRAAPLSSKMLASVGDRLDAFYFAFGDTDLYVITDLPDHSAAAAVALTVAQSGKASTKTIVLLTPEEMDAASQKPVAYRPPGR
ncbi:MAG: GYD domain-containing protein [Casimicrobiaceae bacterium]